MIGGCDAAASMDASEVLASWMSRDWLDVSTVAPDSRGFNARITVAGSVSLKAAAMAQET